MDPLSKPMQCNWKYTRSLLDIALSRVPTDKMVDTDMCVCVCMYIHTIIDFMECSLCMKTIALLLNGILGV